MYKIDFYNSLEEKHYTYHFLSSQKAIRQLLSEGFVHVHYDDINDINYWILDNYKYAKLYKSEE